MSPDQNDPVDPSTPLTRRALVRTGGLLAGAALGAPVLRALAQGGQATAAQTGASGAVSAAAAQTVPLDATKVPGLPSEALAGRSMFEQPVLTPTGVINGSALTPHQALRGSITPSDLHFQRHHNGIPIIDPSRYTLTVHGLVDRPLTFTLDELKRFPSVTRVHFVECSGNGGGAYRAPRPDMTPQMVDGLTSNSEWTGVPVSTLLQAVGVRSGASWVIAEGGDAAVMMRSVPLEKMREDAIIAYAQNGEAVRPANGYPARLLLPGYEGNMCVKWLRRLELVDQPVMSKDETSKYTDPLPDGTARQFSFVIDAKSIITSPAYPETLTPGWYPIRGIAWSGRGRIAGVEISTDGGKTWSPASLVGDIHPRAHTPVRISLAVERPGDVDFESGDRRNGICAADTGVVQTGARCVDELSPQCHPHVDDRGGRHRDVRRMRPMPARDVRAPRAAHRWWSFRGLSVAACAMAALACDLGVKDSADQTSGRVRVAGAADGTDVDATVFGFGRTPTAAELAVLDIDVDPSGRALPPGEGTVADGAILYAAQCASCHGAQGEGIRPAPALVGRTPDAGYAFANDPKAVRTIGNYWPYATTLYDYIHRAMPMTTPGTLTPDQTYSVVAWLLHKNGIIADSVVMNAQTLTAVRMPARQFFVRDERSGGAGFR